MTKDNAYARAGVDVDIEAIASRIMYEASKKTFKNRNGRIGEIVAPIDDFAAFKMTSIGNLPKDAYMAIGFDTAGTKVEIAERVGKHDTIAFDLLAMVCDDAVLRGGEPILVGTNLDISSLGSDKKRLPTIRALAKGYVAAADAAGVAIMNGEIAQMGKLVSGWGDFPYHWGAACVWVARKQKILTGEKVRPGDAIVVLRENGFRTNGLSLVRSVFSKKYGNDWHVVRLGSSTLGKRTLTPSIIYSKLIVSVHGAFDTEKPSPIHAVAHFTGGGVPEKLSRVLRVNGLGAELSDLYEPPEIMSLCQKDGNVSDADAYRAWNMGQGMGVITGEPEEILKAAKRFGISARVAGQVTREPVIRIRSRGIEKGGEWLAFHVK